MPDRLLFNLPPEEALAQMKADLDEMRAEGARDQLKDISSDDAFEIGYESAIHDYERLTGPNSLEVGIKVYPLGAEEEELLGHRALIIEPLPEEDPNATL